MKNKTHKMHLDIKDADGFCELRDELNLTDSQMDTHFEFGEYATIEIEVDKNLKIVSAKFLKNT